MDLRKTILTEHSKANCNRITQWVGQSQARFDDLFQLFMDDIELIRQRAAWPLSYAVIAHPVLIHKHFGKLLKNLDKPKLHTSVKRNTVRLLEQIDIPKKYQGRVMNACFRFITDSAEAAAVKAFSLTTLQNLSRHYPEIIQELKLIIEVRWDQESAAFRSRAKNILKEL